MANAIEPGTLYLVATPIGNLGDITIRALDILKGVDVIACEDTRTTGRLLKHFEISTPKTPFHEHNKDRASEKLVDRLEQGQSIALVTDAGTPGISDPAYVLVRAAVAAGFTVTSAPGATAVIPALILSGLPVHSFTFRGFPPRKPGKRKRFMEVDVNSPHTLIFYESPHRIGAFLANAQEVYGDRQAAVICELTKKFETIQRGLLSELSSWVEDGADIRGEFVIVVDGLRD